jgi:hypothetical protein
MIAAGASALAAITAIGVSSWVAFKQRRIQEWQLKQNLFDKRYAVFLAVEEFLMHVYGVDGSVKPTGDEYRRFRYAMEQAEFLFDTDVNSYMTEVNQTVSGMHEKCFKRDKLAEIHQPDTELSIEILKVLGEISGPLLEKRKMVFGPYLQLSRISRR